MAIGVNPGEKIKRTVDSYGRSARYYSENSITEGFWNDGFDLFKSVLMRREIPVEGNTFLDLGCGPAWRDAKLARENGMKYIGVDMAFEMLKIAQEKVSDGEFIKSNVTTLPFKNESFDIFWAIGIIQHIPRELTVHTIKEWRRILTKRGLGFIAYRELLLGQNGEEIVKQDKNGIDVERYFANYSVVELLYMLEELGFSLVSVISKVEESDPSKKWWKVIIAKY